MDHSSRLLSFLPSLLQSPVSQIKVFLSPISNLTRNTRRCRSKCESPSVCEKIRLNVSIHDGGELPEGNMNKVLFLYYGSAGGWRQSLVNAMWAFFDWTTLSLNTYFDERKECRIFFWWETKSKKARCFEMRTSFPGTGSASTPTWKLQILKALSFNMMLKKFWTSENFRLQISELFVQLVKSKQLSNLWKTPKPETLVF